MTTCALTGAALRDSRRAVLRNSTDSARRVVRRCVAARWARRCGGVRCAVRSVAGTASYGAIAGADQLGAQERGV